MVAFGLALAFCSAAQESAAKPEGKAQTEENPMTGWKWANFLILAVGLGYLIGKNVPPLFRKQSDEIHAALAEAAKIKHEAGLHAASVEKRLAGMQREIETLREEARAELAAESERIRHETGRHLQRIEEQSAQEVALMTRGAKNELKKYAAELAIQLAGERIRSRMNPQAEDILVNGFLRDLNRRAVKRTAS
jgi:F-type H+-transporting ATPase subunit b